MKQSDLFRKSSLALRRYASFIEKFGFLVGTSNSVRKMKVLVAELKQMSNQLANLGETHGGEED